MRQVIFHVGLMKSGTTYIQEVLAGNRESLRDDLWEYPGKRLNQQHACYSLCGKDIPWVKKPYPENLGMDLVTKIRETDNNVILSAEALSVLREEAIEDFVGYLGVPDKIIFTIRGLDKTLPSAWQQYLKGGGRTTFLAFIERLEEQRRDLSGFWRTYGFGHAVKRWSRVAPVDVVVVPRKPSTQEQLWELFRDATGLPQVKVKEIPQEKSNASLSLEAAQILRHMNKLLPKQNDNSDQIRNRYLQQSVFPNIGKVTGSRIELPKKCLPLLEKWNAEEIELLMESCKEVHGRQEDLYIGTSISRVRSVKSKSNHLARTAASQLIALLEEK